jgi:hypothetical protein
MISPPKSVVRNYVATKGKQLVRVLRKSIVNFSISDLTHGLRIGNRAERVKEVKKRGGDDSVSISMPPQQVRGETGDIVTVEPPV